MARNELTSKRISTIAGRLHRKLAKAEKLGCVFLHASDGTTLRISDVQAVCGSALTQASDKPKRERTKNVKRSK